MCYYFYRQSKCRKPAHHYVNWGLKNTPWILMSRCPPVTPYMAVSRYYGPLAKYVKLRVLHALGMPETFSPPTRVSGPDMHHGTCVTHVPWCIPGLLTSGFLWSRWRGKHSRHSRHIHNPRFYVSGKRPISNYQCSRDPTLNTLNR